MKKLILPLSFIMLLTTTVNSNAAGYFSIVEVALQIVDVPIKDHFGKEMKFQSHKRGFKNVEHQTGDFMRFKMDKTYVQSISGKVTRGTWAYAKNTNTISIKTPLGEKNYELESVTGTQIQLKSDIERITLNE